VLELVSGTQRQTPQPNKRLVGTAAASLHYEHSEECCKRHSRCGREENCFTRRKLVLQRFFTSRASSKQDSRDVVPISWSALLLQKTFACRYLRYL